MIDNLVNKNIKDFENYTAVSNTDEIILNANENAVDIFKNSLLDKFHKKIDELNFNRYPDSDSNKLRSLFASYVGADIEETIVGVGCDEIINNIIDAFVEKDEYTMSVEPTFSMYSVFTAVAGGRYESIPCGPNFVPNIDDIINSVNKHNTKVLFLCSPNNPTGYTYNKEQLIKIIENTHCIIVLDEVYSDFADAQYLSLYKTYERVIVLRTMSKAFSLAAARVGFAVAQKGTMQYLYKVKVPYNLNILSQAAAELMLENPSVMKEYLKIAIKNRDELMNKLKQFSQIKVYDSKSNFILIKPDNYDKVVIYATEHKISFKYYSSKTLSDHIRISVGTKEENEKVIKLFSEVYKK